METCVFLVPFLVFLLTTIYYYLISLRNKRNNNENQTKLKLPPGSMGWPYIGQTIQLYSQHPNIFFVGKQTRYGDIFKTKILGCPCVMLATPDAARFVLVTHEHLFNPTYPKSKETLIGPSALFFHQGDYHTRLRKLIQGSLYPEALRNLVRGIEASTVSALDSFAHGRVINTFFEMKMLSFEVGVLAIFGNLELHYKEELKKIFLIVDRGYNSLPINLPGTPYRKAIKARKRLSTILRKIIRGRKVMKDIEKGLLSFMLNFKDDITGDSLREDQIEDNIIGVLFAAQDTTASAITWTVKYLHDNPKILEIVKAEQKAIRQSCGEELLLTWNHTRNMPFTSKVINESLRVSSIISFLFREAVADIEYKGYLIPKGWKVMPLLRNIHQNPEFFTEPQKFDPMRFEDAPKPNTHMPFGIGSHACPGNQLAKLELLLFLHHLTTRFRYALVGPSEGVKYGPFPIPSDGLKAQFWRGEEEDSCKFNIINR